MLAARQLRLGSLQCGVPGCTSDLRKRRRWRQVVATYRQAATAARRRPAPRPAWPVRVITADLTITPAG